MITSTTYNKFPENNSQDYEKLEKLFLEKPVEQEMKKSFFSKHRRTIVKMTLVTAVALLAVGGLYLYLSQEKRPTNLNDLTPDEKDELKAIISPQCRTAIQNFCKKIEVYDKKTSEFLKYDALCIKEYLNEADPNNIQPAVAFDKSGAEINCDAYIKADEYDTIVRQQNPYNPADYSFRQNCEAVNFTINGLTQRFMDALRANRDTHPSIIQSENEIVVKTHMFKSVGLI